jgi:hypothetical protein
MKGILDQKNPDVEEIISCNCGHLLCTTKIWQDADDPAEEVYISYILTIKGFFKRIKFLFKGVHVQETITTVERFKEIADKLNHYKP